MASPPRNGDTQGIEKAKLVGMVLNKEEKINEEGITDHVTFIFEDETDKIDCHMRLCDVKEMAEIENEMRVTDEKEVADHYIVCGHYEVPRMPGYHEIKEQILECLSKPEHMARYAWVHLVEVIEHCKATYQDVMAILDTLEFEDLVYQPRNSYYELARTGY
ncbi:hypothetical protein MKX03_011433 [Papaver bracteatum]|nr:hypothetical protein MKX03_011433 [Papaver bracteatum]